MVGPSNVFDFNSNYLYWLKGRNFSSFPPLPPMRDTVAVFIRNLHIHAPTCAQTWANASPSPLQQTRKVGYS